MKRNRNERNILPVWHDQPMGEIVTLMEGWEILKHGRAYIATLPDELSALQAWADGLSPLSQMYIGWLDSLIPAARAEIAEWLNLAPHAAGISVKEAVVDTIPRGTVTVFLVIVRLWERFLAVGEMSGIEDQTRWLSQRSREEQLLITRLSRRITLRKS